MTPEDMTSPEEGLRFGKIGADDLYTVGRAAGHGAEGSVYQASVQAQGRVLRRAVKVYRPRPNESPAEFERRAARWHDQLLVGEQFRSTSVAGVFDVFTGRVFHRVGERPERRHLYLIMEWIEGVTLSAWVADNSNRPYSTVMQYLQQAVEGLSYMHSGEHTGGVPIIHRDIKPSNLMVHGGHVRIVDLGLIRGADQPPELGGTPGYWAPEVRSTGRFSERSDVYSLAATAFFLFAGRHPTDEDDTAALRAAFRYSPVGQAMPQLAEAVLFGMERDPTNRAATVKGWFEGVAGPGSTSLPTEGPLPPPAPLPPKPTPPSLARAALGLAALALVVVLVGWMTSRGDDGRPEASSSSTTDPPESETSTSTSSTTTSTTEPPPGPIAAFTGVWYGTAAGSEGEVPLVFVLDEPRAVDPGAPAGKWTYYQCTGPLRLVSATSTIVTLTPVAPDPDECGFGGRATLTRSDDSAAYEWVSDDGAMSRTGTLTRSPRFTTRNPGWPTDKNEAGSAFYANLGVCAAGGSGCSESGQFPSWTACTTNELCIAGGDAPVVDVWRDLNWVLEIPEGAPNSAVALLGVGFTGDQVIDLLDL